MIAQTILPFKLDTTQDSITAQAGLVLFGEFVIGLNLKHLCARYLPAPGSAAGYSPFAFAFPLQLLFNGGGHSLEDLRMIERDWALREALGLDELPSTDAVGDWLRRMGCGVGLRGLERINQRVVERELAKEEGSDYTLDTDATIIEAEKRSAAMTYKGMKGYSPLVSHLAENGLVLDAEFREGNASPQSGNLAALKRCVGKLSRLSGGKKRIKYFRSDSAAYQAELLDWCEEQGIAYVVGADLDAAVRENLASLPASAWREIEGGWIAESTHSMNASRHAFRLIALKRPAQGHLFGEPEERWHALATNRQEDAETVLTWYNQRGDQSENRLKELKQGIGLDGVPCGDFAGNAAFFQLGVLAYNLFRIFELRALGPEWSKRQLRTVRWRFYQTAGKLVLHGGAVWLKVSRSVYEFFRAVRARAYAFALG
jgi:hypothetical protein